MVVAPGPVGGVDALFRRHRNMPMLGQEKEMTQVDVAACAKAERHVRRRMIWNNPGHLGCAACDQPLSPVRAGQKSQMTMRTNFLVHSCGDRLACDGDTSLSLGNCPVRQRGDRWLVGPRPRCPRRPVGNAHRGGLGGRSARIDHEYRGGSTAYQCPHR